MEGRRLSRFGLEGAGPWAERQPLVYPRTVELLANLLGTGLTGVGKLVAQEILGDKSGLLKPYPWS